MSLDAADLAILELDVQKLEPLGRDVALLLIEEVRTRDAETDENARLLRRAVAGASSALIALEALRAHLTDAPIDADRKADAIERELEEIVSGEG